MLLFAQQRKSIPFKFWQISKWQCDSHESNDIIISLLVDITSILMPLIANHFMFVDALSKSFIDLDGIAAAAI